jgi:hypothetical protein
MGSPAVRRLLLTTVLASAVALAGCGKGPEGPQGPQGRVREQDPANRLWIRRVPGRLRRR